MNNLLKEWLREDFKYLSDEDFNKAIEEGTLLAKQAGFTFKSPTETLIEQITNYNKFKNENNIKTNK